MPPPSPPRRRGSFHPHRPRRHRVEEDLLAALENGHRSGATPDVFRAEPLPPDHPFWSHPGVTVTPHESAGRLDGSLPDIAGTWRRLLEGRPFINLADPRKGC